MKMFFFLSSQCQVISPVRLLVLVGVSVGNKPFGSGVLTSKALL